MTENGDASAAVKKPEVPPELAVKLIRGEITLGEFVGLTPSALYAIANLGHQMLTTGRLEKAMRIYRGLVAASPYDSVFHCHLAATLYAMGEHEEAIVEYSRALDFNKANVDALAGRGELLLRMSRIPEGMIDLKAAVDADPKGTRKSTLRARATLQMLTEAAERLQAEQKSKAKDAKDTKGKPAPAAAKAPEKKASSSSSSDKKAADKKSSSSHSTDKKKSSSASAKK